MPQQLWRPLCQCSPGIVGMGTPRCRQCGQQGEYIGWHLGGIESMGAYGRRTGLKPIGPHRPMTDELLGSRMVPCRTCGGRGVLGIDEGRSWMECPRCKGACCLFNGSRDEFEAIRARILSLFPDAAVGSLRASNQRTEGASAASKADAPRTPEDGGRRLNPNDAVRCVFYTLAVRNEALAAKWPGGVIAYWAKHANAHNDSLTASCFMAPEWDDQLAELLKNGLKGMSDFVIFDASNALLMTDYEPFHFKVTWLGGHFLHGGVMIYLKH